MISRIGALLLLPALLGLIAPAPAVAQWPVPPRPGVATWADNDIAGTYFNASARGYCRVSHRGSGFLFVNENGSPARFVFTAPGQLQMVAGEWDPNVVVSVGRDALGRMMLRFDSPTAPTGYWVRTN